MKCPSCGAETKGPYCEYCGSELPKAPVVVTNHFYGAPVKEQNSGSILICDQCKSNNIRFQREETYFAGYYKTVAICNSCGNTWMVAQDNDSMMPSVSSGTLQYSNPGVQTLPDSDKRKDAALLLCIFLGGFGAHHFYVGRIGRGIVYLLTGGILGIGWLVDIFLIATGSFKDRYGLALK